MFLDSYMANRNQLTIMSAGLVRTDYLTSLGLLSNMKYPDDVKVT